MSPRVETLIIGAGQAGLALSRHLTDLGRDHLLLDRGRVGQRWRTQRWDSFTLLTPNWHVGLPGFPYRGPDPDGFMDRGQVVDMLERYARSFDAPVRSGVSVHGVRPDGAGWTVATSMGHVAATNVVVATGHHDRPHVPRRRAEPLPPDITQLHTSGYRNPSQLPDGGVLVVGAGPSGQQIAEELALSGRRVILAAGRHRTLPRRYRGRDAHWWMEQMGMFERTIDSLADPHAVRSAPAFVLTGGRRDLDLRRLVRSGVLPVGRLSGVTGSAAWFADDLATTALLADENLFTFRTSVDDFVRREALATEPAEDPPPPLGAWAYEAPRQVDLDQAGIRTVLWATGYRRDFSWIDAPVLDATGEPLQRRGVTAAPGLFFLGLRWMHRRSSDTISGVGRDAAYLAEVISQRAGIPIPAAA